MKATRRGFLAGLVAAVFARKLPIKRTYTVTNLFTDQELWREQYFMPALRFHANAFDMSYPKIGDSISLSFSSVDVPLSREDFNPSA